MKISIRFIAFSAASLCLFWTGTLHSQAMTGSVTQPCNNNGQISVSVTGLTPPISYTYTNYSASPQTVVHSGVNSTSDNLSGISAYQTPWGNANSWLVTASDGSGLASQTFTLSAPFYFFDSIYVASCPAMSTVVALFSGGTAPFSCVWTNQTTSQVYTSNPAAVANGPYGLVATDAAGCMVSTSSFSPGIYVSSNSNMQVNVNGTAANCTNGTATVTVASGGIAPFSYLWNNGATSQSLSGLSQGYLNCVVTDATGCQSSGYYSLNQAVYINYNSTITNATCVQSNGAILSFVSGGTAPYTYAWTNGATTQNISGLSGGPYSVVVTDANGCTGINYNYVNATTPISVTFTASPSSCTSPTGSATLTASGGVAPYTIVWYTYPTSSGAAISNKISGSYSFKVTDANGCVQTGSAYIPPVSSISANLNPSSVICPAITGSVSASVSGSNPPFTYAWSNAATTSALNGVALGSYNCVITDAVGCSVTKYALLQQTSPVNVGFASTPASCLYAADGAVTANATGGTAPYTYNWSNTQTGPNATSLTTGNYYVNVTDANGCSYLGFNMAFVGYNAANNSCYCTITGTVYVDANNNCTQNTGEAGVQNSQIHCTGLGYTYTDANGVYSFLAPTGTYTLTETVQQIYPLAACQTNNQSVSVTAAANCSTAINFANNMVVVHDLHIFTTSMNQPVPGNAYTQQVIVQNDGTAIESTAQMGYTHDGQLSFASCAPLALTQQNAVTYPDWYSITSGFPSLSPGAATSAMINYNVPTNIPLNTVVNFYDSIARMAPIATSWLTDNTPWNNVDNHQAVVVGSFDPNFKEVSPKGSGPQGYIMAHDSILTYAIHFQNTGDYYALNIVVVDTLDADLNLSSLRPGFADHACTTSMSDNGVVKFTFKNINLPWRDFGNVLSSGMLTYSVKLKKNLPVGTQIKNKAAIYFDYNEPVITNSTLNTLAAPLSVKELKGDQYQVALFPNPANNYFTLETTSAHSDTGVLSILDVAGREVSAKNITLQTGRNSIIESVSQLQNGIYFVQLKTEEVLTSKKLVIAK